MLVKGANLWYNTLERSGLPRPPPCSWGSSPNGRLTGNPVDCPSLFGRWEKEPSYGGSFILG